MDSISINWLAVVVSAIVGFAIGGTLFGPKTLYPMWTKAMGRTEEQQRAIRQNMTLVFGLTFAGIFIQAVLLAFLIATTGSIVIALLVATGFTASTTLSHRLFAGHGYKTWLIEVGADSIALLAMAAILTLWV